MPRISRSRQCLPQVLRFIFRYTSRPKCCSALTASQYQISKKEKLVKSLMTLPFAIVMAACTHASVSTVPMELPGVGTVYRYQGRANFSHQIAEADRVMIDECKKINGGKPVVVTQQMRDLGIVAINNSQSSTNLNATANRVGTSTNVQGTATTSTTGTTTGLRNMNQELLFKCVTE